MKVLWDTKENEYYTPLVELSTTLQQNISESELRESTLKVIHLNSDEALIDLLVLAFKIRDVRGGYGQRGVFYIVLTTIYEVYPGLVIRLLEIVPEYGSWKDMFMLTQQTHPIPQRIIYEIAEKQLVKDEKSFSEGLPISLLAKWAPRERKQYSHLAKGFAYHLMKDVTASHAQIMANYRRRITRLNIAMKTVETLECAGRWHEIIPENVPKAALRVKERAYMNETPDGYIKEPANLKRMICRQNFLYYFETANRPTFDMDTCRYDMVRRIARDWIYGGWRGT